MYMYCNIEGAWDVGERLDLSVGILYSVTLFNGAF